MEILIIHETFTRHQVRCASSVEKWAIFRSSVEAARSTATVTIVDKPLFQVVDGETNCYARQKMRRGWQDLEMSELEATLGMRLVISVNPMHHFY